MDWLDSGSSRRVPIHEVDFNLQSAFAYFNGHCGSLVVISRVSTSNFIYVDARDTQRRRSFSVISVFGGQTTSRWENNKQLSEEAIARLLGDS